MEWPWKKLQDNEFITDKGYEDSDITENWRCGQRNLLYTHLYKDNLKKFDNNAHMLLKLCN